jgi:hypothetical protein
MFLQFQCRKFAFFTYFEFLSQADEPYDDPSLMDDYMRNPTFEEGFKGE